MRHFVCEFTKRAPSKAQLYKAIKAGLIDRADTIELIWGENSIGLEYFPNANIFIGWGWIKRHAGADIARDLTARIPKGA